MIKNKSADTRDYFSISDRTRKNLKNQAIKSGGVTVASRALSTIIQVIGVIVLARLLTPDDFGLVTMVAVFTNIFFLFQDIGLEDATIQTSEINHEQISTLFWINLAFSFGITIVLIALSPAVAWFYKKPELKLIMMISSVSYIFMGLTTQPRALLKRNMLFFRVGIIGILSSLLSTVASIILALVGARYWAIVFRPIIAGIVSLISTWMFCRWRPSFPRRNSGVRPLIKFGANSVGFYIVNYFATNMDKTFVGKKFGAEQVGYYGRAYYLSTTPSGQLGESLFHVAVSTLSKLRENPDNYRRYYLNAISAISFIGMPVSIFMVVMSKELVYILLGSQWNQAAEIFSVLGLVAGMNILYSTIGWLHISLGRSDRWLKWGILGSTIMVSGYAIGLVFGPKGVAAAYSGAIILLTFPGILYAGRPIGLRFIEVFSKIWRNIFAAILAGILFSFVKSRVFFETALFIRLVISLFSYFGGYLLILIILYWDIKPIREFISLLRIILSRKSSHKQTD